MNGRILDEIMRDDGYTDVRDLVHTDDLTLPIPAEDEAEVEVGPPPTGRRIGPPRKIAPHVVREIYESPTPYKVAEARGVTPGAASSILARHSHKDVTYGLKRGTDNDGGVR